MLLLHGFMGHAHLWDDFAIAFNKDYYIIALDQRGHGESSWTEATSYTLDDHFSDIAKLVDALDLNNLIIAGHSMGGRNALFYAACVPEKVHKLILIDSRMEAKTESSEALKKLLARLPLKVDSLEQVVKTIKGLYPYIPIETVYHISKYGYVRNKGGAYIPKFDTRMSVKSEKLGCFVENLWPFLKIISCPTLIVRGEKSQFLLLEEAIKICDSIPNAILRNIPRATHMPVQENPIAFYTAMRKFLENSF